MLDTTTTQAAEDFKSFFLNWKKLGSIGTEDVLSVFLPLAKQVGTLHATGKIAPLNGIDKLQVSLGHLWFANSEAKNPFLNWSALEKIQKPRHGNIHVTQSYRDKMGDDDTEFSDAEVADPNEKEIRAAYYKNFQVFEQRLGHHDPLSDIFVLGLVLGSLATQLDLSEQAQLNTFVERRRALSRYYPRIHPAIAKQIRQMTTLDRDERAREMSSIVYNLEHYREQDSANNDALDITEVTKGLDKKTARQNIQSRLRNRLFDLSRRNRLLYFRDSSATTNLTIGSVPMVLDTARIRAQQILHFNEDLCRDLNRPIELGRWLRFEDYGFLTSGLDKLRLDAQRDEREYGFSQLRLVVAFLKWTNLKEAPNERISSPLIMIPVKLSKRKGVKDSVVLEAETADAEINPVLKHHLKKLYNINLPDRIDITDLDAIRSLHSTLAIELGRSAKEIDLRLIESPRVVLIQRAARRKLDDFRRRRKIVIAGSKSFSDFSYNYARNEGEPLGVQIFERDVRTSRAPNYGSAFTEMDESLEGELSSLETGMRAKQVSGNFYAVDTGENAGPYDWEIDLASVTLANFNYRKMTLVRDYAELVENESTKHINFDKLFNREARMPTPKTLFEQETSFEVVPTDPSQLKAVFNVRRGESFVIQGPPGSGKSQTITNLIADAVANRKTILFVCEKRAALDVVFHRLRQAGLHEICAIIHDSQADKKLFVEELKSIYEHWIDAAPAQQVAQERAGIAQAVESAMQELECFAKDMQSPTEEGGLDLRRIIEIRLQRGSQPSRLEKKQIKVPLPRWMEFSRAEPTAINIGELLKAGGQVAILARSPFRLLRNSLAAAGNSISLVEKNLPRIEAALIETNHFLASLKNFFPSTTNTWGEIVQVARLIRLLQSLAVSENLKILDADQPKAIKVCEASGEIQKANDLLSRAQNSAHGWADDIACPSLDVFQQAASKWEGRFLSFMSSGWRQAKQFVQKNYTGQQSSVSVALGLLGERIRSENSALGKTEKFNADFGFQYSPELAKLLQSHWASDANLTAIEKDVLRYLQDNPSSETTCIKLAKEAPSISRAEQELATLFVGCENASIDALLSDVSELGKDVDRVPQFVELLQELEISSAASSLCLRQLDLPIDMIASVVLDGEIERAIGRNRTLSQFDSLRLEKLTAELLAQYVQLRQVNAQFIIESCRQAFREDIAKSNQSMAGTTQLEKDNWRDFRRGRKTLENEFQKSRSFKSVRDLFAGEAGLALRRLKPIWLMSPLSVADILPLSEDQFDLVVFDEASQIPVEDAVPTLYRSKQMVVVGDEMQLPPSNFFATRENDDDAFDDADSVLLQDFESDSFLNRASAVLPKTMLNWHYRSRHESLIAFCNRAFYQSKLHTIPGTFELPKAEPKSIENLQDVAQFSVEALSRPISFHHLAVAPYDRQTNTKEAQYVALLLREVFRSNTGKSVGIVAFSQAQQSEIERALDVLAETDTDFRNFLDQEEEREEDGQFVGLFIKNLENVQGDERDIIILSICYGPDARGRMIMNFGPINQNGGEKRLNVIFSRAKHHMMVVSSIKGHQITNVYNQGANALRQYLIYAEAAARGDITAMNSAMLTYGNDQKHRSDATGGQLAADQIANALTAEGFTVVRNHGQSNLRCHVSVSPKEDTTFKYAIFIDDDEYYSNNDLRERYLTKNSILPNFGWSCFTVLAKDWQQNPSTVIEGLKRRFSHK
jgi:AAA domain/Protein of unknown function (DUF4011)/REase_MTES_1575